MTVYIVTTFSGEILGVFSSQAGANDYIGNHDDYYYVEGWSVE